MSKPIPSSPDLPFNFDINIPDEYLIRIGRINVAWGSLESVVDIALARLGGFNQYDPRSVIITAHMAWPLKMDILESLAQALAEKYPPLRKFSKAKSFLEAAQKARNHTAHGQWIYKDSKVLKLRFTARGKLKSSTDPISLKELDIALHSIGRASRAVLDVIFDCGSVAGAVVPDEEP